MTPAAEPHSRTSRLRWLAISVFVLSYGLNYLDRQLLAAVAPAVKSEFQLSNEQYGMILSVFSIVYALASPAAGLLIDRVGLNLGASLAVAAWSFAGIATGVVSTFRGLLGCRIALGVAEAAGMPCIGKANALYLPPSELALGVSMNQVGISLGSAAAPLIVAVLMPLWGWRSAFLVCGALGLLWIPLWWLVSRTVPPQQPPHPAKQTTPSGANLTDLLRDRKLWGLVVASMLYMTLYTLWTNWTTLYFVQSRGMSLDEANRNFAWIPPLCATLGGFAGGSLAFRAIRSGIPVQRARMRVCWLGAALALSTASIPWMPNPILAAAGISMSFFACLVILTNVYSMPTDLFGVERAAFGGAVLTFAYGAMQAVVSPLIGRLVDLWGFSAVCVAFAFMPMAGVAVLRLTIPQQIASR
jgi:ACS family hexuronate transporter-like MFS transporter